MTTLDATIDLHRQLYHSDLWIERLVSRQPPTSLDLNTGVLHQEPGAATGMPMSGRMLRYLSHPEGYGSDFPWSKALAALKYHCRKNHPDHRRADRPYWRGSLCWQVVFLVVVRGFSPTAAGQILRLERIEPLLPRALRTIEDTMDDYRAKAEKRAREDEGRGDGAIPVERPAHHAVPGLHAAECPQCRRAA